MEMSFNKEVLLSLMAASIFSIPVFAQVSVPANVDPGAINAEINIKPEKDYVKPKKESIDSSKVVPIETPAVQSSKKILLNSIKYTGNSVFKTEELEKISSELIGKKVTFEDLNNVAKAITNLYQKEGYLTSRAIIPPQTMKDGILEISIIEGTVGDIEIRGGRWIKTKYLKKNILKANKVEEDKLFNINGLSDSMAEINRPKYLKGKVNLEKGDSLGETDIVLDVKDRFPLSLGAGWNNAGRELVGVQRAGIYTSVDNLTGYGDTIWANNTFARRTYGLDTGYTVPLNENGTKLTLGYSLSDTELGGSYKTYNIEGESHNFSTAITHPLYKSENWTVNSRFAFDIIHSDTTIYGTSSLNKYDVRVLRTGISATKEDFNGRWLGNFTISTGLPILGATENSLHGSPDSKFMKFNPSLTRVQKLPKGCLGIMKASAQFATDTLLSAEQMQLGGMYTVRGFEEGILLGDTGYNLSFEARTPIPYAPDVINLKYRKDKVIKFPLRNAVKLAFFYDQGWTKVINQGRSATHLNFLQSVGTGLRIRLGEYLTANCDFGVPLGRKRAAGQNDIGFHFGINAELF